MAYTSRLFPTNSARGPSQGSAAEARGAKRKRGICKAPGGRVWPIPRDCFPRFWHGARHRAVPRRPEAPSENEVFSRRLAGERGLYLAIVSHDLGRALTEGSAGDGSAEAPGREESFERPRVVAYAPRGARFPFGFGSPPFAPGAMKRDARGRAGRIALNAEAKKGRTCYTKSIFSLLLFRAAGKNRPKGPNAISPQNLAFTGVNSPTRFEAPSPASKQAAFGSFW